MYLMFWIWLFWYIRCGYWGNCMSVFPDISLLFIKQNVLSLSDAVTAWECEEPKIRKGKKGCFLAYSSCRREACETSVLVNSRVFRNQQVTQEHILVKYHLNPYWKIKHHRRSSIYLSFEALNTQQRHMIYVSFKEFLHYVLKMKHCF